MFCCSFNFFLTSHYRYFSFPFFEAFSLYPDLLSRVCFTRTGIKMFRYANICGFSLLSPYKIAVHEIHVFLLKIILPFTRGSGQHKETTGQVFRFPCRRMVCAAVQEKRCQSVSSEEEKSFQMNCKTEGSKGTAGLEWQLRFGVCSTISTFIRAYLGDTAMPLRQEASCGGQMACYFPGVWIYECLFYSVYFKGISSSIEIFHHTLQKAEGVMMQHTHLKL